MTHKQLLEQVLEVVQQYLPPDGIDAKEAMYRIIGLVDPMPEEKTIGQHREEFEGVVGNDVMLLKQRDGTYVSHAAKLAWKAWKAARGVTE